jgi:hypothetical protein
MRAGYNEARIRAKQGIFIIGLIKEATDRILYLPNNKHGNTFGFTHDLQVK